MKTKLSFIILVIIAIIAIISLVLVFKAPKQAAVTYHQILHRDYAVFVDYRVCDRAPCGAAAMHIDDVYIGDAIGTHNAICQCPDGKTYQIGYRRPY